MVADLRYRIEAECGEDQHSSAGDNDQPAESDSCLKIRLITALRITGSTRKSWVYTTASRGILTWH
jgi:hypothetical protein